LTSAVCCNRRVESSPGMPSTWSKWPCVSSSRSSLRKPAPLRSNCRWVPSPQSTRMRLPPASTRRPGWLRSAEGTLADVPRKVRSNMPAPSRADNDGLRLVDASLANDPAPLLALAVDELAEPLARQIVHVEALHGQLLLYIRIRERLTDFGSHPLDDGIGCCRRRHEA